MGDSSSENDNINQAASEIALTVTILTDKPQLPLVKGQLRQVGVGLSLK